MEANDQVTEWGQQLECFSPGTAEQRLAKYQVCVMSVLFDNILLIRFILLDFVAD